MIAIIFFPINNNRYSELKSLLNLRHGKLKTPVPKGMLHARGDDRMKSQNKLK